jgi:hypothetical protein
VTNTLVITDKRLPAGSLWVPDEDKVVFRVFAAAPREGRLPSPRTGGPVGGCTQIGARAARLPWKHDMALVPARFPIDVNSVRKRQCRRITLHLFYLMTTVRCEGSMLTGCGPGPSTCS